MLSRCLFSAVVVAAMPAQETVSAVVSLVGYGTGFDAELVQAPVTAPARLEELLTGLGWHGVIPAIDFARRRVAFVDLGDGRGGKLAITKIARGAELLVKIEGEPQAAIAKDRWAVIAYRAEVPGGIRCETDDGRTAARCRLSAKLSGAAAPSLDPFPSGTYAAQGETGAPICLADAASFAAFVREHVVRPEQKAAAAWGQELDFGANVVIAAIVRSDQPQSVQHYAASGGAIVRVRSGTNDSAPAAGVAKRWCAMHAVPRCIGTIEYEEPIPGRPATYERKALLRVEDPRISELMPVLRHLDRDVENRDETLCKRATTRAEWRQLKKELDEFNDLPDDWCDFTSASVLAIATEAGAVWPGFVLNVTTEEGVDVLTATQSAPSGVFPGIHSYAMLAVVPHRQGQLAVVLRSQCGPGPGSEKTLRVLPPIGR